jgi:hypothetical protein
MTHALGHLGTVRKLLGRRLEVANVDWCAIYDGASCYPTASDRVASEVQWDRAVMRSDVKLFALAQ